MIIMLASAILRDSVGTEFITAPLMFSFDDRYDAFFSMLYKMY